MTTPQPSAWPAGALIDPSTVPALPGKSAADVAEAVVWASGAIIGYCGQSFGLVTDDVVVLEASQTARGVQLPEVPVTAVTAVSVGLTDGTWSPVPNLAAVVVNPATGWLDLSGVFLSSGTVPWGWPDTPPALLPAAPLPVQVTYSHGYATLPAGLASVCTRLALSYMRNPIGRTLRKVGDEETRYDATIADFSPAETRILDRYSSVTVA